MPLTHEGAPHPRPGLETERNRKMSEDTKFYGAYEKGGELKLTDTRATEESAVKLANKKGKVKDGFAVEAADADEARTKAEEVLRMREALAESDDFEPTAAELEEAATARAYLESDEAREAVAQAKAAKRGESKPKGESTPREPALKWFAAYKAGNGRTVVMDGHAEQLPAREAVQNEHPDEDWVVIHARDEDDARAAFDALGGEHPETRVVTSARQSQGTDRKPLSWTRTTPVEGIEEFHTAKSGTLHGSTDCHHYKRSPGALVSAENALERAIAGDPELKDDEGNRVRGYCFYCTMTSKVEEPAAEETEAAEDLEPANA